MELVLLRKVAFTALLSLATLGMATTAMAGAEPYGQPIGKWKFNQTNEGKIIVCRAFFKNNTYVIGGNTGGGAYVSIPQGKVPTGKFQSATVGAGDAAEFVPAQAANGRAWFASFPLYMLDEIAKAGGFRWDIPLSADGSKFQEGTVKLDANLGKVIKTLKECIESNGG